MTSLTLEDRLGSEGDAVYAALMTAHAGLTEEQSHALNARLVLMLANEIGDRDRLEALFSAAREIE
ncbi:DUF2783 domain-containing protein [Sulfitobacter sp. S0837]|uniref:DUF2783 domain-containing protein n=1 Tax=Sulfitobacter maritimus TaxID=2741719 RepID=UPI00158358CF|nr:DUF2783 domain-containing protein [Sulfitobacter maritimus]NUH66594.1 DUF2783 domain-containing protein [Sulfitobacter maritimus]